MCGRWCLRRIKYPFYQSFLYHPLFICLSLLLPSKPINSVLCVPLNSLLVPTYKSGLLINSLKHREIHSPTPELGTMRTNCPYHVDTIRGKYLTRDTCVLVFVFLHLQILPVSAISPQTTTTTPSASSSNDFYHLFREDK